MGCRNAAAPLVSTLDSGFSGPSTSPSLGLSCVLGQDTLLLINTQSLISYIFNYLALLTVILDVTFSGKFLPHGDNLETSNFLVII